MNAGRLDQGTRSAAFSSAEKAVPGLDLEAVNRELYDKEPLEIISWAVDWARGNAMVSTNFRPHSAVMLHLTTRVKPDIPVLWVDTGYNTPATYRFAEKLINLLDLRVRRYIPERTAAHRDALNHGIPSLDHPEKHEEFTREVKLEPFQRGLRELNPDVWFAGLRKVQTSFRRTLDVVSARADGILKVNPILRFTDQDMKDYLQAHRLPDEHDYYDPTKVLEHRECGLHTDLTRGSGI
jgi:phosphoadenosine phosphosulfate reductase